MHHAITVGGLLLSVGVIVGLIAAGLGLLMVFAAGMSDAGDDGTGGTGCAVLAGGVILTGLCIAGFLLT
jgi:hypothetical protein